MLLQAWVDAPARALLVGNAACPRPPIYLSSWRASEADSPMRFFHLDACAHGHGMLAALTLPGAPARLDNNKALNYAVVRVRRAASCAHVIVGKVAT